MIGRVQTRVYPNRRRRSPLGARLRQAELRAWEMGEPGPSRDDLQDDRPRVRRNGWERTR